MLRAEAEPEQLHGAAKHHLLRIRLGKKSLFANPVKRGREYHQWRYAMGTDNTGWDIIDEVEGGMRDSVHDCCPSHISRYDEWSKFLWHCKEVRSMKALRWWTLLAITLLLTVLLEACGAASSYVSKSWLISLKI